MGTEGDPVRCERSKLAHLDVEWLWSELLVCLDVGPQGVSSIEGETIGQLTANELNHPNIATIILLNPIRCPV